MKKLRLFLIMFIIISLVLVGCGGNQSNTEQTGNTTQSTAQTDNNQTENNSTNSSSNSGSNTTKKCQLPSQFYIGLTDDGDFGIVDLNGKPQCILFKKDSGDLSFFRVAHAQDLWYILIEQTVHIYDKNFNEINSYSITQYPYTFLPIGDKVWDIEKNGVQLLNKEKVEQSFYGWEIGYNYDDVKAHVALSKDNLWVIDNYNSKLYLLKKDGTKQEITDNIYQILASDSNSGGIWASDMDDKLIFISSDGSIKQYDNEIYTDSDWNTDGKYVYGILWDRDKTNPMYTIIDNGTMKQAPISDNILTIHHTSGNGGTLWAIGEDYDGNFIVIVYNGTNVNEINITPKVPFEIDEANIVPLTADMGVLIVKGDNDTSMVLGIDKTGNVLWKKTDKELLGSEGIIFPDEYMIHDNYIALNGEYNTNFEKYVFILDKDGNLVAKKKGQLGMIITADGSIATTNAFYYLGK